MINSKRNKLQIISIMFVLICTTFSLTAQDNNFIKLGDTQWKGSVFGDIGGPEVLTPENFEITQNDDTFLMASRNNRGKLSSSTDGLAFLYQSIPADANFEMTVTVEVKSFNMNNQVSFGIMLRDTVYENFATKENFGSYLAVGPINITKEIPSWVFYRTMEEKTSKISPITYTAKPAVGSTYEISFIKDGDSYTLTYGDEDPFTVDDFTIFNGNELFIGVYTSRNTEVIYSDINLEIE